MANRIELDGTVFAYEDRPPSSPSGEPAVLFIHGLGGSAYSWWAQAEAVAAHGHRAIAIDQRGAGLSSKPQGPYSVDLWASDVERILEALRVDRVALVAHSVGCMTAEHVALRCADRVCGLVLFGGALRWRPEAGPVFEERVRLAGAGRMDEIASAVAQTGLSERCRDRDPALHGLFCELIASNDPRAYAEWCAGTAVAEMIAPERVSCPALACCGELDPVTPPAFAEAIAEAIPGGRTAVIDGAAHWCQLESPAAANDVLLEFLRRRIAT